MSKTVVSGLSSAMLKAEGRFFGQKEGGVWRPHLVFTFLSSEGFLVFHETTCFANYKRIAGSELICNYKFFDTFSTGCGDPILPVGVLASVFQCFTGTGFSL